MNEMKLFCNACKNVFSVEPAEGIAETPCTACGADVSVPEKKAAPGVVIGDFLIEQSLSKGGMGEVYIARQLSLDRPVALKVLQERFTNNAEYVEGLFREARAAAKITHPNIVQAYAVGEENGVYYFAMELIRGETFKQILKRENILDFSLAAKVVCEVAGALDVAWREQKLVHQDIKPDNIMLDSNGFAKLADLGLAHSASTGDGFDADADEVLGTPQYISPEQLTGVPTDVRSDIYSLGATFYQFVTGQFPYVADTAEEITKMHVEGNLTPPKQINPALPDALNAIIVKMMARKIEDRYQLPSELVADLKEFLNAPQGGHSGLKRPGLAAPGGLKKPGMPTLAKPGLPGAKPALVKPAVPGAKPALVKPAAPGAKPALVKPAAPGAKPASGKPGLMGAKPAFGKPAAKPAAAETPAETPAPVPAETVPPEAPAEETPKAIPSATPVETPAEIPAAIPVETPAEAPAETPAETPAPKDDEITLAPETKRRKKTNENENGENAGAEGENSEEKGKKKTRRQKDASEKKPLSKSVKLVISLLIALLILGGAAGGFYFAAKKDKLPAKLKPWGEKALALIGQKPDVKTAEAAEKTQETPKAQEPEKPKEPEKPRTRPEYIAALEAFQREFRNTDSSKRKALLAKADELFRKLGPHQTPEELDELIRSWQLYSTADETLYFASAREAALAKYEKAAEARRAALAKEEERRQKQKEEDARREQELKQQNAEFDRDQQKRLAEIKIRFTKLKAELDVLNIKLVKALISSAESGDDTIFENALQESKNHVVPTVCDTIAERAEITVFETIKRLAPSAFAAYKSFIISSKNISARGLLMIPVNGTRTLVRLTGITADGKLAYRTTRGEKGLYVPNSVKERRSIEAYLIKNTDLTGGAFYYNLLTRYMDPAVAKYCPNQFWALLFKHYRTLALR